MNNFHSLLELENEKAKESLKMMYGNQSDSCYGLQVQVNGNLIATGFGQQEQQQMMASFNKSWAQQTEESYQLQLALALRVSSQAASAADSYFLDFNSDANKNNRNGSFPLTSQDVSHRFWVAFLSSLLFSIKASLLVSSQVLLSLNTWLIKGQLLYGWW